MPVKINTVSMTHPPTARGSNRGFTLVELMAVVVISGILSVIGVSLFRHQVLAAKGSEAVDVITAIRSAQESYQAENHIYLNVSTDSGGTKWYPNTAPDRTAYSWVNSAHLDYARWQALGVPVNRAVLFGYLVNAGEPGTTVPPLQLATNPGFPSPMVQAWYVIQAKGDPNGNNISAMYAAASRNTELMIENEGE